MAPNRGGRWAETGGGSFHPLLLPVDVDVDELTLLEDEVGAAAPADLSKAENGFKIAAAAAAAPAEAEEEGGSDAERERSQMESSARPWATEARRPTVQTMVASRVSSREASRAGSRWAART